MKTKLSIIYDMPKSAMKAIEEIQSQVAEKCDNTTKLDKDFHVTLAVADALEEDDVDEIVKKIKPQLEKQNLNLKIGPIDTLVNHKNEGVAYLKVESEALAKLHWDIRKQLEPFGAEFTFPEFKAHITLAYLDKPVTDEQKKSFQDIEGQVFNGPVKIGVQELKVSIKDGEDWRKVAYGLCKRAIL